MKSLFLFLPFIFAGCTSTSYNYQADQINISEPALGSVQSVGVGETMLRQGKYSEHEAIRVTKTVDYGFLGTTHSINTGTFLKVGEDAKNEYFGVWSSQDSGSFFVGFLQDQVESIQLPKNNNDICLVLYTGTRTCTDDSSFQRYEQSVLTEDSFQQTLIYSGKVGDKINIGYREFSNSAARPAFNNDVEYDLSESQLIGYRGAELEILEATNTYIRYRVNRNFNAASF